MQLSNLNDDCHPYLRVRPLAIGLALLLMLSSGCSEKKDVSPPDSSLLAAAPAASSMDSVTPEAPDTNSEGVSEAAGAATLQDSQTPFSEFTGFETSEPLK